MSKVERALLADVPAIAALQMDAFSDDYFTVTKFPIEGGVGERYYAGGWEGFVRREEEKRTGLRSRAVVIRGENGEPKAGCLLFILADKAAAEEYYGGSWRETWGQPLEGMNETHVGAFFEDMKKQHKAVMGNEPHVYVEIIMTHSTARRRGHAMALLQSANAIADELGLPLYLDSEKDVVGLYERVGYVRQPEDVQCSDMVPMKRPASRV